MTRTVIKAPASHYVLPPQGDVTPEGGDNYQTFVAACNANFIELYTIIGTGTRFPLRGPAYPTWLPNQRDFTPEHGDSFKLTIGYINTMFTEVYSLTGGTSASKVTLKGPVTDYMLPAQRDSTAERGDDYKTIIEQINAMFLECYGNAGVPTAPSNTVLPLISGTVTVGSTLTTSDGTWAGFPTPTFTYQWKSNGTPIGGATANTYTLISAQDGTNITVTVTATNASGSANATSLAVGPVMEIPANTVLPVISGSTTVGSTLSTTTGTWTGSPGPSFSYQWNANSSAIAGATSSTYVLQSAQDGQNITVTVTGTNGAGSANATSAAVGPVTEGPVNTVLPVITGTAAVGSTLSTTNGTWVASPAPSFTYQWNSNGSPIGGATANTYTLLSGQAGTNITVTVTATNVVGSGSATSAAVGPVTAIPANTVLPVISGSTTVGSTLTTTNGTWTGSPAPTFTYQWKSAGTPIGGATTSSYVLQGSDIGNNITVTVTATNAVGSANATSAAVGPVTSGGGGSATTYYYLGF